MEAAAAFRAQGEPAAADALPTTSPYTLDQITGDWLPTQAGGEEAKRAFVDFRHEVAHVVVPEARP